jgi:hypothetical protein
MLLLGSMGTLASLWSDMLFPAMTSIQQDLGTSATAVQQTVSLFFVANAGRDVDGRHIRAERRRRADDRRRCR